MLSVVESSCCACFAKSGAACGAGAAAGKSSLEMPGEGASLSWLPVSVALLGAGEALVTAMSASTAASPFCDEALCDEAAAKGEVGIEPSLTCPFASGSFTSGILCDAAAAAAAAIGCC